MITNAKYTYVVKTVAIIFWIAFVLCATATVMLAQSVLETKDFFNTVVVILLGLVSCTALYKAIVFTMRARKKFTIYIEFKNDSSLMVVTFSNLSPFLMNQAGNAQLIAISGVDLIAGYQSRAYEEIQFEVKQSITFGHSFQMALTPEILARKDVLWFLLFRLGNNANAFASFQLQDRFN